MRGGILALSMAMALVGATAAFGQASLHSGAGGLDQPAAESSLLPVSGFSLDGPALTEDSRDDSSAEPRPSDGLRLQIYDSGPAPATLDGGEGAGSSLLRLPQ